MVGVWTVRAFVGVLQLCRGAAGILSVGGDPAGQSRSNSHLGLRVSAGALSLRNFRFLFSHDQPYSGGDGQWSLGASESQRTAKLLAS